MNEILQNNEILFLHFNKIKKNKKRGKNNIFSLCYSIKHSNPVVQVLKPHTKEEEEEEGKKEDCKPKTENRVKINRCDKTFVLVKRSTMRELHYNIFQSNNTTRWSRSRVSFVPNEEGVVSVAVVVVAIAATAAAAITFI